MPVDIHVVLTPTLIVLIIFYCSLAMTFYEILLMIRNGREGGEMRHTLELLLVAAGAYFVHWLFMLVHLP